jgi:hypothetical protein
MSALFKRYALYLFRWQLSTPILALCLIYLVPMGKLGSTIVANLIGGLIFFWVDRFIFTHHCLGQVWEIEDTVTCSDCGKLERGYRLVCSGKYDKRDDPKPEFRCRTCSERKTEALRRQKKI